MKKILVLVLVLASYGASVSAVNSSDYNVFYKLNNETTFNSLARYLDVDFKQADQLKYVFSLTEDKLNSALKKDNEVAIEKAMRFNLSNAKFILSDAQYKKYLTALNMSINNDKQSLYAENL